MLGTLTTGTSQETLEKIVRTRDANTVQERSGERGKKVITLSTGPPGLCQERHNYQEVNKDTIHHGLSPVNVTFPENNV